MRIQTNFSKQPAGEKEIQKLPKPSWLKIRPPKNTEERKKYLGIRTLLAQKKLNTVCTEANCPNASECWSSGTATFMILGDTCTRACKFCNVKCGNPKGVIDPKEPENIVEAVKIMKLNYVVITCVTRDDLEDGGAQHFANCIKAIKEYNPKILVEVLISDLGGNLKALQTVLNAAPDVLAYNVETVERLQFQVRDPRASYKRTMTILGETKKISENLSSDKVNSTSIKHKIFTKTSLMLGLGETEQEIIQTMKDLRAIGVDIITFGQYLQPSSCHQPVIKYYEPKEFKHYEQKAQEMGFMYCASGPLVRSSYKAGELFVKGKLGE